MLDEVVPKNEFAKRCNVSAGRVSQWIAEGKIGPDEMVGEGRNAQIRVAAASEKLKIRLDAGQRNGHGLKTTLPDAPAPTASGETPKEPSEADKLDLALKREKLTQQLAQNRKAAEEERARQGIYVRAADVASETAKMIGRVLQTTEAGLVDMADEISRSFTVPKRDVLHLLRRIFREQRAKLSKQLAIEAAEAPATVEDDET